MEKNLKTNCGHETRDNMNDHPFVVRGSMDGKDYTITYIRVCDDCVPKYNRHPLALTSDEEQAKWLAKNGY